MTGQWTGTYRGTNTGQLTVNLDDIGHQYAGVAYSRPDDSTLPFSRIGIKTPTKDSRFDFTTRAISLLSETTCNDLTAEELGALGHAGLAIPEELHIRGEFETDSLRLTWESPERLWGEAKLNRLASSKPSDLQATTMNWREYKEQVSQHIGARHLFRGQPQPWRLRTAFHRTGRADLVRFMSEDMNMLHQRLSGRTRHIFNRSIPVENGSFLNLAQHHGYPTPLLDWTYSPYIAAFFAYRFCGQRHNADRQAKEFVRIFMLNEKWKYALNQLEFLERPFPHLSVMEFVPIDNERVTPQQAVSTVTNVDDVEAYIATKELETNQSFLTAIDLPVAERDVVIRDLNFMGVTAGTLFPGLDGVCEELKELRFARQL